MKNPIRGYLPYAFAIILIAGCSIRTTITTAQVNPAGNNLSNGADYFNSDYIRYENHIYSGNIHTIQLYREGWVFAVPIITFGTDEKLMLSFDDLDGGVKDYKYTLVHCSATWNPSDLTPSEYLEGLTEDFINDHEFSFNTNQAYTHYSMTFPGENVRPLLSGNYLLKVFLDDADNTLVFTRKLMIVEPKVSVDMQVKRATNPEEHDYHQAIDFTIDCGDNVIDNPYVDMKVILMQNGRWDNARYDLKPRFVRGNILDFTFQDANVFSGGNEFRHFDIKSLKWYSDRISKIYTEKDGMHVILMDDQRVTFKNYLSVKDINGNFLIKSEDNVKNSDLEAEYVWVHFFLKYETPLIDGNIYVFGGLSDWQFLKDCKMTYNYDRKGYECALYVKQGYYNYQYIFVENGKTVGDESLIEGTHYETENEYTVLVYNRERGTLYDKLIAVKQTNTYSNK